MAFTTKKYTRPFLVETLRNFHPVKFQSYNTFVTNLSPRARGNSAAVAALSNLLGGNRNLRKYFTAGTPAGRKANILEVLKTKV